MFSLFKSKPQPKVEPIQNGDDERLRAYIPRAERENSFKAAVVTFPTGYKARGIVVDYSATGVRIRFQTIEHLPEVVTLSVPGLNMTAQARLVWSDRIDYGLEFLQPLS